MKHNVISYIGLGSNLAHPIKQLTTAIPSLQQLKDTHFVSVSRFYQTLPMGFTEQPNFINAVACLETTLSPQTLLLELQKIENRQGRIRYGEKNGPRTLDLDILLYDTEIIEEADLRIPHPRLEERAFVLIPLLEIAPELILPNGKYAKEFLLHLGDTKKLVTVLDI